MFWGVKLECGKQYSQLVERSFHISHAALQIQSHEHTFPDGVYEVHAIVEKTDYILCYLGWGVNGYGSESPPLLCTVQQPLNLNISEGEEIILYIKKTGVVDKDQTSADASVYLTGYFVEEPTFAPNLDEFLEDDEHLLDDDSDDDDNLHGDNLEGQDSDIDEQSLTTLLLEGSLEDSDSDDDFTAELETPVERRTRKRLAQPPVIEEIKDGEKASGGATPPSKRKRSSGTEGEASTLTAEPTKAKKKKKKKERDQENGKASEAAASSDGKAAAPKSKKEKKEKKPGSFKTPGGTEVQELRIGSGKIAKPGSKVFVKYTGRLAHNQKIFDSNITQKKPFMFQLGQGEVIKGWDEGVNGMRIGGKRKLLIPPKQGYGSAGAPPDIPPNSKLLFDVEVVGIK